MHAADGIIGIGNSFTRATYAGFDPVVMINGASLEDATYDWQSKNDQGNCQHFLFYGSKGSVHKGLDLALEAFIGLEQHLWVMAPLEKEFERVIGGNWSISPISIVWGGCNHAHPLSTA